jgi:D-proline reductase (dithiol) PrdB
LEANGIPTVVIGSARDIVDQCGVPRFLFQDFPLGNPCGVPYDSEMQHATMGMALDLLGSAVAPRTTVQTPFAWPDGGEWRTNYMRVDESNIQQLRRKGRERREGQARRKLEGRARTT